MGRKITSKNFQIEFGDTSLGFVNDFEIFRRYYLWVMDPASWDDKGNVKTFPTSENTSGEVIRTPFMDWHYWEPKMWNIILRELILDTESVIQGRIYLTARTLTEEMFKNVKQTLEESQKHPDTAGLVFNVLPSKIHNRCKLRNYSKETWKKVNDFYLEVRNNLMHWKQVTNGNKDVIQEVFILYREIYKWLERISVDTNGKPLVENSVLLTCFPGWWKTEE